MNKQDCAALVDIVRDRLAAKGNVVTIEGVVAELNMLAALPRDFTPVKLATPACVVCGCDVENLDGDAPLTSSSLLRGAGTIELSFGYGSTHDTDYVVGVICDKCAEAFVSTTAAPMTSAGAGHAFREHTKHIRD